MKKGLWTIAILFLLAGSAFAAWDPDVPADDGLLEDFPAACRANWDAIELGTDALLQITNAKVATGAAIDDAKLATINDSGKVSGTALTGLASTPSGAGVLPDANVPGKLKADASDTTPQYLDSLIDTAMFQISGGDLLQLKDAGVGTEKLVNGSSSPGNSKYYGTNGSGTKGFFDLTQDHGGLTGLGDDDHTQYYNAARFVAAHDGDDHSGLVISTDQIANGQVTAVKCASGVARIKAGTYTGDGQATRNITGIGFDPDIAFVSADSSADSQNGHCVLKIAGGSNGIQLTTSGASRADQNFRVSTDGFYIENYKWNSTGKTYYYVAMAMD